MQRTESVPEKFGYRVKLVSEFLWFVQFRWVRCLGNFTVWAGFAVDKSVREVASKRGGGFLASKASFFNHGWPLDDFFLKLFIQSRRKEDFVQKPWFLSIGAGGEEDQN